MIKVEFRFCDGRHEYVEVDEGVTVMEAAIDAGIDGIDADCGGQLSCATCHVYVDPAWRDRLPPMSGDENDLLDFAINRDERSRLCCQIQCTIETNGIAVEVPETQR
jgi:2Fe-2S ferredoxin